jgi:DoxX-like family
MQTIAQNDPFAGVISSNPARSRRALWAGRVMSGLAAGFLIFDSVGKLLEVQPVIDGTQQLGYPADIVFSLGVILLSCVLAYLVPRTSVFGALLLTGYLGGAVATHVRVGNPLFTHVLFPTYVAALLWGGLMLRDTRLRAVLLPSRDRRRS